MLTCTLLLMLALQMGHVLSLELHFVQRQRCLHGSNSTHDSSSPQFLQLLLLSWIPCSSTNLRFSSSSLLSQQDSASSAKLHCCSLLTCASTCSRLLRSAFAVASFDRARSLHIWFSMKRLFTLSSKAQFKLLILSISSSFDFSRFLTPSFIAAKICFDCCCRLSARSILILSICWTMKRSISTCCCCIWRETSWPKNENRWWLERKAPLSFWINESLKSLGRFWEAERLQVRPLSAQLFVVVTAGRGSA